MAAQAQAKTGALYLVIEVHAAARDHLAAILTRHQVASILFKAAKGQPLSAQALKPLVDLAQSKDAAALLLDDAALARALRADGVHLSATHDVMSRYEDARSTLGSRAIVGADCGGSRHIAMELGEAGAEYVAFSANSALALAVEPDADTEFQDLLGPLSQSEMVSWWSDVFEVPCVAFDVSDAVTARDMARAGADFVAVTAPVATSPADVVQWYAALIQAVESADA